MGAALVPTTLWGRTLRTLRLDQPTNSVQPTQFYLRPRYRSERDLDGTLRKVQAGLDAFTNEKHADLIAAILGRWSAGLLRSPREMQAIAGALSPNFLGCSLRPSESRIVRSAPAPLMVQQNKFTADARLDAIAFLRALDSEIGSYSQIHTAEFQITSISAVPSAGLSGLPSRLETEIRYEIVGSGQGFHREQRVGSWHLSWESSSSDFKVSQWRALDETRARSSSPVYVDITSGVIGVNSSYSAHLAHGADYWRTVLDGACGIDVYGHNGISIADVDNDGLDDLYVCQTAGLPNRLYRNRGDGTFEDITESSGLGVLENTVCALFADFENSGRQDVIIVQATGPLLFVNDGKGKFHQKSDAFQFATPPQGTFTGAALADYDRDGWLDVYFCLYSYYQGTGQYKYPTPYHDANNGPPNFLMRNLRDGTFRDVTAESGLNQNNTRYSFCCGWGDYNHDGWPDLYVVNDFGRKNLYHNNGDGTFTDVAPQAGVEDLGAGMSVSWFDYDNDAAQDLYVANMWTASGVRVSTQESFKKDSAAGVRSLYQKHAMGNSMLRNRSGGFEDTTRASGAGIGRWAWSSDTFDFDHDGFPDLYIANGMISGPSRTDLNSFFWRQVVASSPDDASSNREYENGWNAINELIRADGTWSGYERNVFYANNRDGTFSDVSAAVGLDFLEDARSFTVTDFDGDGRLEIFLKNRNAPQLRVLQNIAEQLPPSISFRLQGVKSNRDAIGAFITIETSSGRQTKAVQAGSGFLSQHTKDVLFGLGDEKGPIRATIRWPSGLVQELRDLPIDHGISVAEGSDAIRKNPFKRLTKPVPVTESASQTAESLPTAFETWLLAPVPAPEFSLPDTTGKVRSLKEFRGKPVLLNFWTPRSLDCITDLATFEKNHFDWSTKGLQLLALNVGSLAIGPARDENGADAVERSVSRRFAFPILHGSDDAAAVYNILYRQLFGRHRDLILPTSFLINGEGYVVKLYQGSVVAEQVEHDFLHIPRTDTERLARALPFPSANFSLGFGRNHLSFGSLFYQRGYLEQAEISFRQALLDDPTSAEALYGIGSVYLNQNKNTAAREMFERCVQLRASYPETLPDAWNNLGVLATREGRMDASIENFRQALNLNPRHLLALDNLGNAYRLQKRWDEARQMLGRALEVAPDDPEANYSLGMVYAQTDDTTHAYEYLQRALRARPVYPEALNNLAILYLVTKRPDDAVKSFEECIRVAPEFDQAYLNLARVYGVEGKQDKARTVLLELLKRHPDHPQARQMLGQLQ